MDLQARLFLGMASAAMVFFQLPHVGAFAAPAGGDAVILWNANAGVAATKACIAPLRRSVPRIAYLRDDAHRHP